MSYNRLPVAALLGKRASVDGGEDGLRNRSSGEGLILTVEKEIPVLRNRYRVCNAAL